MVGLRSKHFLRRAGANLSVIDAVQQGVAEITNRTTPVNQSLHFFSKCTVCLSVTEHTAWLRYGEWSA
jgi:hypothetical protein